MRCYAIAWMMYRVLMPQRAKIENTCATTASTEKKPLARNRAAEGKKRSCTRKDGKDTLKMSQKSQKKKFENRARKKK